MTEKKYFPTIGLEIHAELKTKSKMFCGCPNNPFAAKPNQNICEVCTAQPGSLPYVNKEAVKKVMKVGLALKAKLATFSEFDRKNYFYPDIPKAYQISQYKYPLVSNGVLAEVEIERVHLEEDTATSIHKDNYSLVDFNRAGVPLMELVTKPTITSAEEAMNFAKELQLLLRTLGVSDANLEKGEMRIEANVSVSTNGSWEDVNRDFSKLGVKTEVKNLNSFKIVGAAIDYEIKRQIETLESGEEVIQETRGWDENKNLTFSQRKKENSADYRYFPDPDIPKYDFSELEEFSEENLKKELPELPWETRVRYEQSFKIKKEDIEFYLQNPKFKKIFDKVSQKLETEKEFKLLSNNIISVLAGREFKNINEEEVAKAIKMLVAGDLSSNGIAELLKKLTDSNEKAEVLAKKFGLIQKSDAEELKKIAEKIISENSEQVEAYKNGEEKMLKYFLGQGMKATQGSANPQILDKIFRDILDK